jgi:hypothetical protein
VAVFTGTTPEAVGGRVSDRFRRPGTLALDLPIAPARILGLGQGAAGQNAIEAALSRRLIPPAWGSFSSATLTARAAWLQYAADSLRHPPARPPTGGAARVALLLLLLEAGEARSVFEQAKSMAVRLAEFDELPRHLELLLRDLQELVEHACRSAAVTLHRERRFEAEDRLLAQAAKLLDVLGAGDRQQGIERNRQRLVPYRILDLLSRDLADHEARAAGLELLGTLMQQRGGLNGVDDPALDRESFGAFLDQIRSFMTLQEWIDCSELWHRQGDAAAGELLAAGLVASGFQQRKPARIDRALRLLEGATPPPQDQVLAWLHLLLGDVDWALALDHPEAGTGPSDPSAPADDPTERLGALCAQCHRWLGRSLLPGYRDSDTHVDLEAWFEDREVVAYLDERHRGQGKVLTQGQSQRPARNRAMPVFSFAAQTSGAEEEGVELQPLPTPPPARGRSRSGAKRRRTRRRALLPGAAPVAYMLLGACLSLGLQSIFRPSKEDTASRRGGPQPPARGGQPEKGASPPPPAISIGLPFAATDPSAGQVGAFLQEWLDAKGGLLAGRSPLRPLQSYATAEVVEAVNLQHRDASERGLTQRTLARIERVEILEHDADRLRIEARIRYADETLARDGTVVKRTPLMRLRNTYVFRRAGGAWKLEEWSQTEAGTPLPTLSEPMQAPPDPNRQTNR